MTPRDAKPHTSLHIYSLQGPPNSEDSDCDSTELDNSNSGEALQPPASLPPWKPLLFLYIEIFI